MPRRISTTDTTYAESTFEDSAPEYFTTSHHHYSRDVDIVHALQPLVQQLRAYDSLRQRLELHGGDIADLKCISHVLKQSCLIQGRYQNHAVSLSDQHAVRRAIHDIGAYNLRLEVRQGENKMPLYYICRIRGDYWSEYRLIVEDLYRSPGYPLIDRRFVRIMRGGHEVNYLRLSQFRGGSGELLAERLGKREDPPTPAEVDGLLYRVGRYVLQSAWHEDQRLATMTAYHFRLPQFRNAIELLYLCLTGDICELRSAADPALTKFFHQVYPQSGISGFIEAVGALDGARLNSLPEQALGLYYHLCNAFSCFLEVRVNWGYRRLSVPLYKILYANYSRVALIAASLIGEESIKGAAKVLECEARTIIAEIVGETTPRSGSVLPPPPAL